MGPLLKVFQKFNYHNFQFVSADPHSMHVFSNTVLEEVSFLGCLDFISSSFRIYNLNLDALTKTFHVMGPLILRKSWLLLRFFSEFFLCLFGKLRTHYSLNSNDRVVIYLKKIHSLIFERDPSALVRLILQRDRRFQFQVVLVSFRKIVEMNSKSFAQASNQKPDDSLYIYQTNLPDNIL